MAEGATPVQQTPTIEGAGQPANAVEARLGRLPADALAGARQAAAQRLRAMGLPRPRDEYWRYTDPAAFNAAEPADWPFDGADAPLFADVPRTRIVLTDGRFDATASDPIEGEGIEITPLSAIGAGHWAAGAYGTLEAAGQTPVPRPFAALNTAAAQDGLAIRVTGRVQRPLHIVYRRSAAGSDVLCHHLLRMEAGSELTLLETGLPGARANLLIEADLAAGARLHHLASQRAAHPRVGLTQMFARVAEDASLKSFALSVDGLRLRNEAFVDLAGDGAVAHVAGAILGDGRDGAFHHDDTVFIVHGGVGGESRQVFKKVLKNGAVGVFQGKILVRPGAQKTDGYQISQALLLDEASQFLAKPELEIYADDVRCSHGSTTGAIDETALFYLRSRGVPRERAIVLLVLSFLADALDEIEDAGLREAVSDRLEQWLTARAAA